MNNFVFKIKNLTCEYSSGEKVLFIEDLNITRGKLIFIVGRSGVGKSTFVETLGLMNNTILASKETELVFHSHNGNSIDLTDVWSMSNDRISELRRDNYSFIFQMTNLMPNFSAGENMMMSLLIEGYPMGEAKKRVYSIMDRMFLPRSIFDKKVVELSGGQRQRLAFVRAITSRFSVLFGDEPTGNLDAGTSRELLRMMSEITVEREKSVLIVSHDVGLAESFADVVIPIYRNITDNGREYGIILKNQVFEREQSINKWKYQNGELVTDFVTHVNAILAE